MQEPNLEGGLVVAMGASADSREAPLSSPLHLCSVVQVALHDPQLPELVALG